MSVGVDPVLIFTTGIFDLQTRADFTIANDTRCQRRHQIKKITRKAGLENIARIGRVLR